MTKLLLSIYNIIYNLLNLINTILIDLCSVRNFLVTLTFCLCVITIYLKVEASVIITALGCWTIILNAYFANRQKTQELEAKLNTRTEETSPTTEEEPKAKTSTSIFTQIWNTIKNLF